MRARNNKDSKLRQLSNPKNKQTNRSHPHHPRRINPFQSTHRRPCVGTCGVISPSGARRRRWSRARCWSWHRPQERTGGRAKWRGRHGTGFRSRCDHFVVSKESCDQNRMSNLRMCPSFHVLQFYSSTSDCSVPSAQQRSEVSLSMDLESFGFNKYKAKGTKGWLWGLLDHLFCLFSRSRSSSFPTTPAAEATALATKPFPELASQAISDAW